jgi:cytochrome b
LKKAAVTAKTAALAESTHNTPCIFGGGKFMSNVVRVWDLPTRIFHWALVAAVIGLVTSAQIGGEAMAWHFRFGYAVLTLLLFRILWGLTGGHWSRFASFIYSPVTILGYLKGQGKPEHTIGHNPLGSLAVFAMLGLLLLQVGSGLFSDDEIAAAGPLVSLAPSAWVSLATYYHAEIGKLILLGLLVLHVGTILFYRFRKGENLVKPMVSGDKETPLTVQSSRDDAKSRLLAGALLLACAVLVTYLVQTR